jgi:hypothetical protein
MWVSSSLAKNTSAVDLTKGKATKQLPQKMQKENQWCNLSFKILLLDDLRIYAGFSSVPSIIRHCQRI